MTIDNPLALAGADRPKRGGVRMSAQEWCDFGNSHLDAIGRHDVRWFVTGPEPRDHELRWIVKPHANRAA